MGQLRRQAARVEPVHAVRRGRGPHDAGDPAAGRRAQRLAGRSFGHIGRNRREPPPDRGVCPRNGQDLRRLGSAIDRVLQVAAFATVSRAGEIPRCAPRDGRQHRHPEQDDGRRRHGRRRGADHGDEPVRRLAGRPDGGSTPHGRDDERHGRRGQGGFRRASGHQGGPRAMRHGSQRRRSVVRGDQRCDPGARQGRKERRRRRRCAAQRHDDPEPRAVPSEGDAQRAAGRRGGRRAADGQDADAGRAPRAAESRPQGFGAFLSAFRHGEQQRGDGSRAGYRRNPPLRRSHHRDEHGRRAGRDHHGELQRTALACPCAVRRP